MGKHIFCYSIMHSGTWFLIRLVETCNGTVNVIREAEIMRKGKKQVMDTTPTVRLDDEWIERTMKFVEKDDVSKQIQVIHAHHLGPQTPLIKAIGNDKETDVRIIAPMRDPLLGINTLIWRHHKDYDVFLKNETTETRMHRASHYAAIAEEILQMPKETSFIFPIDTATDKRKLVNDLFEFCNIKKTRRTENYMKGWVPQNKSEDAPIINKNSHNHAGFQKIKEAYKVNDKDVLEEMLSVEMAVLKQADSLKEALKKHGYKDLPWW